jgi:DNA repair protein SbcC/Rad50
VRLVRLAIRRLPGIHEPFEIGERELGGRVHVVHGPNASGKSSLVRAVRALLWPETLRGEGVEVEARFLAGATTWVARRDGSRVVWQRDGQDSAAPQLPTDDLAKAFLVSIEDVSRLETADFADEIRREMSGGVDFAEIARAAEWNDRAARDPRKALDEAQKQLRDVQGELDALDADARRLAELEAERVEARRQASELAHLAAALDLCSKRSTLSQLEARASRFPPAMDRLRGDELDLSEELGKRVEQAKRRVAELDSEISKHGEAAARCKLATPLDERTTLELSSRVERLRQAERELRDARARTAGAEKKREVALGHCFGARPEVLLDPAKSPGSQLDTLVRDAAELAGERRALETELERLPRADVGLDPERANAAMAALRSWLNAPAAESVRPRWPLLLLALLAAVLSVVLALALHPAGWAGLVLAALFAWQASTSRSGDASRAAYEAQYAALGLGAIAWERASVEARFVALEAVLRSSKEQRDAGERRAQLERDRARLDDRERDLQRRRAAVREALGIDTVAADFDLALFARSAGDFRSADGDLQEVRAELTTHQHEREQAASALQEAWTRHGLDGHADVERAAAAVESLKARSSKLTAALDGERRAVDERKRAETLLEEARQANAAFWSGLALDEGDEAGLRARIELLAEYREVQGRLGLLQRGIAELQATLGSRSADADLGVFELEQRRDAARLRAERVEPATAEITEISTKLDLARRGLGLEAANAEHARCREEFKRVFDEARAKTMAAFLVEDVRGAYEREAQPEVLKRADASLKLYTHGQYGLIGERRDGGLRALDVQRGISLPLEELSTGTRAQLLLAVRLAFASQAARGESPPVFLDDALATSDARRIRAVGEALREASRASGAQFFYLTTEAADASLIAGDEPEAVDVIDLAALRGSQQAGESRARLALPEVPVLPLPGTRAPEEYAELLGVPAIDGRAGVDALHVFYVLRDDLAGLHRVLEHHVERVGPLRAALAGGVRLLEPDASTRAQAWIVHADAVLNAWCVGRGKPVEREILAREDSGVTDTFLDKITDLARELGGDAKKLIDALERNEHPNAARFRQASREKLRELLEREGYLDPRTPLEREIAWRERVLPVTFGAWTPTPRELRERFEWLWALLEPR